jgi:hypothetical protein
MFVLSTRDNALFRGIATLLAIALVSWAAGAAYMRTAEAASVNDFSDLLSTSATSTASNHTIEFVTPTGIANNETITITFPIQFTGTSSILFSDVDIAIAGVDKPVVAGAPGAGQWGFTSSGDVSGTVFTFTAAADESAAALASTTIEIGTNATFGVGGANQIINPAAQDDYEIDVAGTMVDSGHTRVAIVESVYVTANVSSVFEFTVSGFATAGADANGTTTTGTTTSTQIPFGNLQAGVIETLAQRLNVTTNASNGYVVTVETDQQLTAGTGDIVDGFRDSSYIDTPEAWGASPLGTVSVPTTYGHWGLTTDDANLQGAGTDFASDQWVSASTTPRAVMAHDGPADGLEDGTGSTTVAYQIEITALQEAADDYQAMLTYIATPTF